MGFHAPRSLSNTEKPHVTPSSALPAESHFNPSQPDRCEKKPPCDPKWLSFKWTPAEALDIMEQRSGYTQSEFLDHRICEENKMIGNFFSQSLRRFGCAAVVCKIELGVWKWGTAKTKPSQAAFVFWTMCRVEVWKALWKAEKLPPKDIHILTPRTWDLYLI